jgi:hypothetical protein
MNITNRPPKMLIIHGVGDFCEATIVSEVRVLAEKYAIDPEDLRAFNWDKPAGAPFRSHSLTKLTAGQD